MSELFYLSPNYTNQSIVEVMENKIYVAVGKDVEDRVSVLNWALNISRGETICVIHVHVPSSIIHNPREMEVKEFLEWERKEVVQMLDDCLEMCSLKQVPSEKILIEKESVTDGILELVSRLSIQTLVMGAGANSRYLRSIAPPDSDTANYVLNCAPDFCHVWFVCNDHLVYTREQIKQLNPCMEENEHNGYIYSEGDQLEAPFYSSSSAYSDGSSSPFIENLPNDSPPSGFLTFLETILNIEPYDRRQQDLEEAKRSRQEAENEAIKATYMLKETEEELTRVKKELKDMKTELQKASHMLLRSPGEISSLERKMQECNLKGGKVEENNHKYNNKQGNEVHKEPSSSNVSTFTCKFSKSELEEATKFFDPSLIIWERDHVTIYKGFLYHTEVAIKIVKSQGITKFKQEVDVLSKLHHPNLVTLIGACPDSPALIYEYLVNGNLEDRLLSKNNPLPWHIRIEILAELCSVLNFLHSIQPCSIIHSDLNPQNILLDTNFSCKLSGFGFCHMITNKKQTVATARKRNSYYMDPEFLETGHLSPKLDVYSFGIIVLQLLTGKISLDIREEIQHALEHNHLDCMLDPSAGEWPFVRAKQLAYLALKCCNPKAKDRPDFGPEIWNVLKPVMTQSKRLSNPLQLVDADQIPSYFICPIFQEIMRDPHFAADGFTYEEEAIRGWFEGGHNTSPMTNIKLDNHKLTPNHALRSAIREWLQHNQLV